MGSLEEQAYFLVLKALAATNKLGWVRSGASGFAAVQPLKRAAARVLRLAARPALIVGSSSPHQDTEEMLIKLRAELGLSDAVHLVSGERSSAREQPELGGR